MLARVGFVLYIPTLLLATHWPNLQIDAPVQRPDLYIHLACFGLWAFLLALSGWAGAPRRWPTLARAWLISAAFASFDEGSQAIEFFHRTCAWDDWGFNLAGVTIGCAAAFVWWRLVTAGSPTLTP